MGGEGTERSSVCTRTYYYLIAFLGTPQGHRGVAIVILLPGTQSIVLYKCIFYCITIFSLLDIKHRRYKYRTKCVKCFTI